MSKSSIQDHSLSKQLKFNNPSIGNDFIGYKGIYITSSQFKTIAAILNYIYYLKSKILTNSKLKLITPKPIRG